MRWLPRGAGPEAPRIREGSSRRSPRRPGVTRSRRGRRGTVRDRGVHRQRPVDQARRISSCRQLTQHAVPGPVGRHSVMPRPHRVPRPEHLGQITLRDPGPVPVDGPLHHEPGVRERPTLAPRRTRRHFLDQRPLSIRQDRKPRHRSRLPAHRRSICQTRPRPLAAPRRLCPVRSRRRPGWARMRCCGGAARCARRAGGRSSRSPRHRASRRRCRRSRRWAANG